MLQCPCWTRLWGKQALPHIAEGKAKWNSPQGGKFGNILKNYIKPVIPFVGIYPKDTPTIIPTYMCTWLFMTTLLVPAKYWKLPRCPKQGNWLHTLLFVHPREYHVKKKEESPYELKQFPRDIKLQTFFEELPWWSSG